MPTHFLHPASSLEPSFRPEQPGFFLPSRSEGRAAEWRNLSSMRPTKSASPRVACFPSSIPLKTLMPCWPDLRKALLAHWWMAWPILLLVITALMVWAPVRLRWVRITVRLIGGVVLFCLVSAASVGLLLNSGNPKPEHLSVASPSGSHLATLTYQAGFLGRDYSTVKISKKGCCEHFTAYEYAGPSHITAASLVWADDSHLRIRYIFDPLRRQRCETHVADVDILCEPRSAK